LPLRASESMRFGQSADVDCGQCAHLNGMRSSFALVPRCERVDGFQPERLDELTSKRPLERLHDTRDLAQRQALEAFQLENRTFKPQPEPDVVLIVEAFASRPPIGPLGASE